MRWSVKYDAGVFYKYLASSIKYFIGVTAVLLADNRITIMAVFAVLCPGPIHNVLMKLFGCSICLNTIVYNIGVYLMSVEMNNWGN